FRRADIELYETVRERMTSGDAGGEVLRIVQNFRSVPGVIDWVNGAFSPLIVPPADGRYQPAYIDLQAARPDTEAPAVLDLKGRTDHPTAASARREEAGRVASLLEEVVG